MKPAAALLHGNRHDELCDFKGYMGMTLTYGSSRKPEGLRKKVFRMRQPSSSIDIHVLPAKSAGARVEAAGCFKRVKSKMQRKNLWRKNGEAPRKINFL
jgi:hypothetical protein